MKSQNFPAICVAPARTIPILQLGNLPNKLEDGREEGTSLLSEGGENTLAGFLAE